MAFVPPFVRRQCATLSLLVSLSLSAGILPQGVSSAGLVANYSVANISGSNFIEDRFYYSDASYTTLVGHSQTNFCTRETTLYGEITDFSKVKYTRCYY